jgi:GlcNAc-P-P-Und epimerase
MRPIIKVVDEKQRILVTGASGFVGSALIDELLNAGKYEIFGLAGKNKKAGLAGVTPLEFFRTDISEYETLQAFEKLNNIDTLVHAAGLAHQFGPVRRADFWKINVQGTENICRLAKKIGIRHFVLISSVAVYGKQCASEIDETFECRPADVYAETKLQSERRAIEFCESKNIRLTILRLATVIGEGDRGNTSRLITLIDKKRFLWVGKGANKKSLIYKADVAKAILKSVEVPPKVETEIYNLTAEAVSMSEIVGAISTELGKKIPRAKIPESLVRGIFRLNRTKISVENLKKIEKTFEKWLSNDIFSGEKFNETFNFKPETPVSEALARQVNYYLNQKTKSLD